MAVMIAQCGALLSTLEISVSHVLGPLRRSPRGRPPVCDDRDPEELTRLRPRFRVCFSESLPRASLRCYGSLQEGEAGQIEGSTPNCQALRQACRRSFLSAAPLQTGCVLSKDIALEGARHEKQSAALASVEVRAMSNEEAQEARSGIDAKGCRTLCTRSWSNPYTKQVLQWMGCIKKV